MDFILHVFSSIQLYVQTFEFNASIYYVVRWIGYQFTGYNIIASAGITLSLLTLVGILVMAYLQKGSSTQAFLTTALWSITLYFVLATTVHPWYITTLVMLCTFTSRYPILWSGLIVSSYSAYAQSPYTENLYLVGLEYVLLLGFLVYECKTKTMAYKPLLENQG
jgi:alpha-1,6-mannosyltransferase